MPDGGPSKPSKPLQKCSVAYISNCSSDESDVIYVGATKSVSEPSDEAAENSCPTNVKRPLLTGGTNESSEHLAEGLREKNKKEEVCEEAVLKENILEHENSGDGSVRGAAGLMNNTKGKF